MAKANPATERGFEVSHILAAIEKLDNLQKNTDEYRKTRNEIDANVYSLLKFKNLLSFRQEGTELFLTLKNRATGKIEAQTLKLPLYAESNMNQFEAFPVLGEDFKIESYRSIKGILCYVCLIKSAGQFVQGIGLKSLPLACLYTRLLVL